jgi:hypothetical protein
MWTYQKDCKKMKITKVFFLISLLLVSCGSVTLPRVSAKKKSIDPVFKPYIAEYRNLIGKHKYQHKFDVLSMNFTILPGTTIGRCWWLLNGDLEIEIDKRYWDFYNNTIDRQFLVYHELEHCIRSRMHTNRNRQIGGLSDFFDEIFYHLRLIPQKEYLDDGCPVSLMHSSTMSKSCQEKHYLYYLYEIINYKRERDKL